MSVNINNREELDMFLRLTAQDIMNNLIKEIKEYLKKYVQDNLYNKYSPSDYDTTYQFIDSISSDIKVSGSEYNGVVFFDTTKIYPKATEPGRWNQHMGTIGLSEGIPFDGEDFIKQMEEYGRYTNDPTTNLKGIHMIRETKRALSDGQIAAMLIKAASMKGYTLIIR